MSNSIDDESAPTADEPTPTAERLPSDARERPWWELPVWALFFAGFLATAILPPLLMGDQVRAEETLHRLTEPVWAVAIALIQLVPVWMTLLFAHRAGRSARSLGLHFDRGPVEIALGIAAFVVFSASLSLWTPWLAERLPTERIALPALTGPASVLSWGIFTGRVGFMEEWVFRGYGFGVLASRTGRTWLSAIVMSALFGLAHLYQGWGPVLVLTAYAFYLNAIVLWRRSLVAAMTAHFVNDFTAPLLARFAN